MVDACRAQCVPEPEYEVSGGFVRIVFRRTMETSHGPVNGPVSGPLSTLTDSLKQVYVIVKDTPGLNIKQIADLVKKPYSTVKKQVLALQKRDLIEHRDSDKTGGYYVKN